MQDNNINKKDAVI